MTAIVQEDAWEQFTAEFPSDQWMREVLGRRWLLQLQWAFFANIALYFVGPRVFGSDVGMANAHEKVVRTSLNPIRFFRGYPYVVSYFRALQDDRVYTQFRRDLLDATLYDAVLRLRLAMHTHDAHTVQIPLISEGIFCVTGDMPLNYVHNKALASEFLAFIDENGTDWGMASWKITRQQDDVYLLPKPEYWEARKKQTRSLKQSTARSLDDLLK